MTRQYRKFRDVLIEDLKNDPHHAEAYMKVSLEELEEDGDHELLQIAIDTVIKAGHEGLIPMEIGNGNVFADLDLPDAEAKKRKADMSYNIEMLLEKQGWSHQKAAQLLSVPEQEIARVTGVGCLACAEEYLEGIYQQLVHLTESNET